MEDAAIARGEVVREATGAEAAGTVHGAIHHVVMEAVAMVAAGRVATVAVDLARGAAATPPPHSC